MIPSLCILFVNALSVFADSACVQRLNRRFSDLLTGRMSVLDVSHDVGKRALDVMTEVFRQNSANANDGYHSSLWSALARLVDEARTLTAERLIGWLGGENGEIVRLCHGGDLGAAKLGVDVTEAIQSVQDSALEFQRLLESVQQSLVQEAQVASFIPGQERQLNYFIEVTSGIKFTAILKETDHASLQSSILSENLYDYVDRLTTGVARAVAKASHIIEVLAIAGSREIEVHASGRLLFSKQIAQMEQESGFNATISNDDYLQTGQNTWVVPLRNKPSTVHVISISNQTLKHVVENVLSNLFESFSNGSNESVLIVEDAVRSEPWELSLRPVHLSWVQKEIDSWEDSENAESLRSAPDSPLTRIGFIKSCWRRHQGTLSVEESVEMCMQSFGWQGAEKAFHDLTYAWEVSQKETWSGLSVPEDSRFAESKDLDGVLLPYVSLHENILRSPQSKHEKLLVYSCNALHACGGNGDRFNGIVSAFLLAVLTDRSFIIDADFPYPLQLLWAPNRIDWRAAGNPGVLYGHREYIDKKKEFVLDLQKLVTDQSPILSISLNHRHIGPILDYFCRIAGKSGELAQRLKSVRFLAGAIHQFLFKESPYLKRIREDVLRRAFDAAPNHSPSSITDLPRYIAIHFRSGNGSPNSWNDPARHSVETDMKIFLACAEKVDRKLKLPTQTKWFLSADVDPSSFTPILESNAYWKSKVIYYSDPSSLVHTDRSFDAVSLVSGAVYAHASQVILSQAVAGVVSRSYFGEVAMEIGSVREVYYWDGCVKIDLTSS